MKEAQATRTRRRRFGTKDMLRMLLRRSRRQTEPKSFACCDRAKGDVITGSVLERGAKEAEGLIQSDGPALPDHRTILHFARAYDFHLDPPGSLESVRRNMPSSSIWFKENDEKDLVDHGDRESPSKETKPMHYRIADVMGGSQEIRRYLARAHFKCLRVMRDDFGKPPRSFLVDESTEEVIAEIPKGPQDDAIIQYFLATAPVHVEKAMALLDEARRIFQDIDNDGPDRRAAIQLWLSNLERDFEGCSGPTHLH